MRCSYEGASFTITVVDAETRRPLGGVHALAEWQLYGFHGFNGPLMVQDVVSGPDGALKFPAWGPVPGPPVGLVNPLDPVVTLFRPGYKGLVAYNDVGDVPEKENARRRRFGQDGRTFGLEPFRGTPEEWAAELEKIARAYASPMSDETRLRFREPYRARLRRVWEERANVPERFLARGQLFWRLEEMLTFFERGPR
jgi:hypothetical protein